LLQQIFAEPQPGGKHLRFTWHYLFSDYHSMTSLFDPAERRKNTLDVALDFLACGLDPKRAVLFKQSDVSEVTELTWLLNRYADGPAGARAPLQGQDGQGNCIGPKPPSQAPLVSLPGRAYHPRMSVTAEKVAEVLALPEQDRAYLARQLLASLEDTVDADAETQWNEVIDRRSREIEEGKVTCRPVEETVRDLRAHLHARRQSS
jgi:putative addiction module component (TIGR02574 family)